MTEASENVHLTLCELKWKDELKRFSAFEYDIKQ